MTRGGCTQVSPCSQAKQPIIIALLLVLSANLPRYRQAFSVERLARRAPWYALSVEALGLRRGFPGHLIPAECTPVVQSSACADRLQKP